MTIQTTNFTVHTRDGHRFTLNANEMSVDGFNVIFTMAGYGMPVGIFPTHEVVAAFVSTNTTTQNP